MELDLDSQQQMVSRLLEKETFGVTPKDVEHIQTHISHVILAGDFAYKIKKPLDLGFLDFSTLARRRFCCEEELRLNRRLAPDLYLEVIEISGSVEDPRLSDEGEILEYAVKMRRFPQSALLSEASPDDDTLRQLAVLIADFHCSIPPAEVSTYFGEPERVVFPMLQNFDQIRDIGVDGLDTGRLDQLEAWTREQSDTLRPQLQRRKREGHIRECHGDMHLGNITRYQGRLQVFDGIEFNPNLSWIDSINDLAFLLMDLEYRGLHQESALLLNEYLTHSGDYEGLDLLRFYQVYRAMVRAKVSAIMVAQSAPEAPEREPILRDFYGYLELAEDFTRSDEPRLIITHGLSGSGKSLFSGWLAVHLPAIRLRSDIERKRLFSDAGGKDGLAQGIYSPDASRRTYDHLQELASGLLRSGYSVIVDAAFLKTAQRQPFQQLAQQLGLSCLILDCVASHEILLERIHSRLTEGKDPSDADQDVLRLQMETREPLSERELAMRVELNTNEFPPPDLLQRISEKAGNTQ